tara:strand:- start:2 stop:886 length:885 start_codon:yes stop_codon:yes gene_type:complete
MNTKSRKKIALCFHGIHGGESTGKNYHSTDFKKGENNSSSKVLETSYKYFYENIIKHNDVDIFFHTWDVNLKDKMVELYKPKKYLVENQKKFSIPDYVGTYLAGGGYDENRGQAHYSRWYSFKKSNELKKQYEEENNFKYDLVMQSRLDLCWLDKIIFENEFNPKYFYTSTPIPSDDNHQTISKIAVGFLYQSKIIELPDRWFVSDSHKMDEFSKLYDLLNDFCNPESKISIRQYAGISSHYMVCNYLTKHLNYDIIHKFKYRDRHLMYRDLGKFSHTDYLNEINNQMVISNDK